MKVSIGKGSRVDCFSHRLAEPQTESEMFSSFPTCFITGQDQNCQDTHLTSAQSLALACIFSFVCISNPTVIVSNSPSKKRKKCPHLPSDVSTPEK